MSQKTGYKWLERYREVGIQGLLDRSRAPLHHPQTIAEAIVACASKLGPAKVRAWLERETAQIEWPATSTIGALFDREGLTVKLKLRRRSPPSSAPFAECRGTNDASTSRAGS